RDQSGGDRRQERDLNLGLRHPASAALRAMSSTALGTIIAHENARAPLVLPFWQRFLFCAGTRSRVWHSQVQLGSLLGKYFSRKHVSAKQLESGPAIIKNRFIHGVLGSQSFPHFRREFTTGFRQQVRERPV